MKGGQPASDISRPPSVRFSMSYTRVGDTPRTSYFECYRLTGRETRFESLHQLKDTLVTSWSVCRSWGRKARVRLVPGPREATIYMCRLASVRGDLSPRVEQSRGGSSVC